MLTSPTKPYLTRNQLKKWYRDHNKGVLPIGWEKRVAIEIEETEKMKTEGLSIANWHAARKSLRAASVPRSDFILDDCVVTCTTTAVTDVPVNRTHEYYKTPQVNKEEETMTTYSDTLAYNASQRLSSRLRASLNNKTSALREKFNLDGIEAPTTFKKLKEMLANGNIVVDVPCHVESDESRLDDGWRYFLKLVDPKRMPDQKGYDDACEKARVAYEAALDIITVKGGDEGLKALNEYQAATFA